MVKKALARSSSFMIFGFAIVLYTVTKGILGDSGKPATVFEK